MMTSTHSSSDITFYGHDIVALEDRAAWMSAITSGSRKSRVPVEVVAQIADQPDGLTELREGFDLSDDEINDARRWWHAVREHAEAA